MKALLVVLIVVMVSGAITVTKGRTYPLSLTPVRPERISRQETRERCPNITVRGAPLSCLQASLQRQTEHLGRTLKRLQRQLEQQRRTR